ncbi:sugar ABC transporter ATP-binding protein [Pendulispora albinea]|uniref:Sugar ABC transporter ATP-binding protein n=1 Tax=Pendulispora albinea TaxID=2741071 RepID=A0ABZ2LN84_9BACT
MTTLVARGLQKTFGATLALRGVDLEVRSGEIHALMGENGAGKSTLMSILSGSAQADAGSMAFDGSPYRPNGPREARHEGVLLVHQELSLCGHMTVGENVMLGIEPARFGFLRREEMRAKAAKAIRAVTGAEGSISLDARAADLSPADRQLVEIARALAVPQCRVLLLDEPTSSLAAGDVDRLFVLLRELKRRSLAIVYISHFLEEIMRVCDVYTVLRDGQVAAKGAIAETDAKKLVLAMSGGDRAGTEEGAAQAPQVTGGGGGAAPFRDAGAGTVSGTREPVLVVEDVTGTVKPASASLTVHRGEIVGIAGLLGAGRTELLRMIFGLDPVVRGTIKVAGSVAMSGASPAKRIAQGVGFLSEDRKGEGLLLGMSIADNLTMSRLSGLGPKGFVSEGAQHASAKKWTDLLKVRHRDAGQPVRDLSGGNQQKIALARLLHQGADLFLLDEPTRGVDINSKTQIEGHIRALAASGKAVLLVSSHLPDLIAVCDRIGVMYRGRLGEIRPVSAWTEHTLLAAATGAN